MASSALWGFIGGFSKTALDQMEKRQDDEREKQKLLLLQELQREQSDYQYNRSLGEVDDQKTEVDYTTGTKKFYNKRGDLIRTGQVTDSDKQAHQLALDKNDLEMQNIRSQIESRATDDARQAAQLGLEKQRLGLEQSQFDYEKTHTGTGGSLDGSGASNGTIAQRAHELVYQNKDAVADVVKAGVPAELVNQTALKVVQLQAARAKSGLAIQDFTDQFMRALAVLRTQNSKNNPRRGTGRSLDTSTP